MRRRPLDYYVIQKLVEGTWVDLRQFPCPAGSSFTQIESAYEDLRNASPDTEYRILQVKHHVWRQGKGRTYL